MSVLGTPGLTQDHEFLAFSILFRSCPLHANRVRHLGATAKSLQAGQLSALKISYASNVFYFNFFSFLFFLFFSFLIFLLPFFFVHSSILYLFLQYDRINRSSCFLLLNYLILSPTTWKWIYFRLADKMSIFID